MGTKSCTGRRSNIFCRSYSPLPASMAEPEKAAEGGAPARLIRRPSQFAAPSDPLDWPNDRRIPAMPPSDPVGSTAIRSFQNDKLLIPSPPLPFVYRPRSVQFPDGCKFSSQTKPKGLSCLKHIGDKSDGTSIGFPKVCMFICCALGTHPSHIEQHILDRTGR